jgi:GNAT superfamily N-acetyltransferase
LGGRISDVHNAVWPPFMQESDVANRAWPLLFDVWSDFQVVLVDEDDGVVAAGHAIPLAWDGSLETLPCGWEAATAQGMRDYEQGIAPSALNAYAIVVAPGQQGKGYSGKILDALCVRAQKHGLHSIIACVRPTLKALYPLAPIERYALWTQPDGSPFDPWIRVHWRAGGEMLHVSPHSMEITGTVGEWEKWTGLRFPESGEYVVKGALQPVTIDVENDKGLYYDPNVWMWHKIPGVE